MVKVAKGRDWQRNRRWNVWTDEGPDGSTSTSLEFINISILQDIRDELRDLNQLLNCHNVTRGFKALQTINRRMGAFDALKLRKPR